MLDGQTDIQIWEKRNVLNMHHHWYKTHSNIGNNIYLDIQNCRYSIDSLHFKMLYILDKHKIYREQTFLSLEDVKKYLSSCDQAHDHIILVCAVLDLLVPDILVNNGSTKNYNKIIY